MYIPIPYAMDYTATVGGSAVKLVACEQCQAEYIYRLQPVAVGSGTSLLFVDNQGVRGNRASSRAEGQLNQGRAGAVDLVPCPACGEREEHGREGTAASPPVDGEPRHLPHGRAHPRRPAFRIDQLHEQAAD